MNHEVLDCPRMIANLESMNIRQENPKVDPETKDIIEQIIRECIAIDERNI
jgi:hypothetical protein